MKNAVAKKTATKKTAGNLAMQEEPAPAPAPAKPAPNKGVVDSLLAGAIRLENVMYCALPVELLEVDAYQRPIREKVRHMADHWDYAKAGVLNVSLRDGHLYIADGQNRAEAAALAKKNVVMCVISTDKSFDSEIDMFVSQNDGVTRMSQYDMFHARCMKSRESDPIAHGLKDLMDKYGIVYANPNAGKLRKGVPIGRAPALSTTGRIGAMHEIIRIAELDGLWLCEAIFETIHTLGWHTMKNAYSAVIVHAVASVHRGRDTYNVRRVLYNVLHGHTPDQTVIKARNTFPDAGPTEAVTAYFSSLVQSH